MVYHLVAILLILFNAKALACPDDDTRSSLEKALRNMGQRQVVDRKAAGLMRAANHENPHRTLTETVETSGQREPKFIAEKQRDLELAFQLWARSVVDKNISGAGPGRKVEKEFGDEVIAKASAYFKAIGVPHEIHFVVEKGLPSRFLIRILPLRVGHKLNTRARTAQKKHSDGALYFDPMSRKSRNTMGSDYNSEKHGINLYIDDIFALSLKRGVPRFLNHEFVHQRSHHHIYEGIEDPFSGYTMRVEGDIPNPRGRHIKSYDQFVGHDEVLGAILGMEAKIRSLSKVEPAVRDAKTTRLLRSLNRRLERGTQFARRNIQIAQEIVDRFDQHEVMYFKEDGRIWARVRVMGIGHAGRSYIKYETRVPLLKAKGMTSRSRNRNRRLLLEHFQGMLNVSSNMLDQLTALKPRLTQLNSMKPNEIYNHLGYLLNAVLALKGQYNTSLKRVADAVPLRRYPDSILVVTDRAIAEERLDAIWDFIHTKHYRKDHPFLDDYNRDAHDIIDILLSIPNWKELTVQRTITQLEKLLGYSFR